MTETTTAHTVSDHTEWSVRNEQAAMVVAVEIAALVRQRVGEQHAHAIQIALIEAIVNGVKHGNGLDSSKSVNVRLIEFSEVRLTVTIEDEGIGFSPEEVPDPLAPENLERPCGRGLLIMRHFMQEVRYNERGNTVTLTRRFQG